MIKRHTRTLLVVGVALAALFAFAPPGLTDTSRVRAVGSAPGGSDPFRWKPAFKHVVPGTRVVWKNTTSTTHHVVAYGGNWSYNESVPAGGRTAKKFRRRGSYKYRCDIPGHSTLSPDGTCSGMCGEIHVAR